MTPLRFSLRPYLRLCQSSLHSPQILPGCSCLLLSRCSILPKLRALCLDLQFEVLW